jgi:hypothetical protein
VIHVNNSEQLQKWLLESGHLGRLWDRPRFHFDPVAFEQELQIVSTQYPRFSAVEAEARAALRLLGKEEAEGRRLALVARRRVTRAEKWLIAAIVLILVLLFVALRARATDGVEGGEGFRSELGRARPVPLSGTGWASPQGQPGGVIIQVSNQGTVLATRPAGLLKFDCGANMTCSFSGVTFSMTAGAGGAVAWSGISNPIANLGLTMGANTSLFTFNAATGAGVNLFNLTDTLNNTGSGFMLNVNLASGSAMKPAQFAVNSNGVQVTNTGLLTKVGTGGLDYPSLLNFPAACGANNFATQIASTPGCAQPAFSNLSGSIALGQTPLTTRGDILTVNVTPALIRLALGASNLYPKSNGTDVVYSTLPAVGPGACTNQFWRAGNADAVPTCNPVSLTADVSGLLPIANAGTNASTATAARSNLGVRTQIICSTLNAFNPAASTTIFFSCPYTSAPPTTQTRAEEVIEAVAGTMTNIWVGGQVSGTLASGQSVTCGFRKIQATDSFTVSTTWNATPITTATASGTFTLAAGDTIGVKCTLPAWTTTPTTVKLLVSGSILEDQ